MSDRTQTDELEDRLIDFAVRVTKLSDSLPKTPAGKHIAGQLLRSRTSAASIYAEARGAESSKNFVHKRAHQMKAELLTELTRIYQNSRDQVSPFSMTNDN